MNTLKSLGDVAKMRCASCGCKPRIKAHMTGKKQDTIDLACDCKERRFFLDKTGKEV